MAPEYASNMFTMFHVATHGPIFYNENKLDLLSRGPTWQNNIGCCVPRSKTSEKETLCILSIKEVSNCPNGKRTRKSLPESTLPNTTRNEHK